MKELPLIAIVHYHLRSGGVTKVISQAVKALEDSPVQTVIIAGSDCTFTLPSNSSLVVLDELNYSNGSDLDPKTLLDEMNKKVLSTCGREVDIWHFHNHSVGKNIPLALAAKILADQGKKILFQIHDFPEDRRPLNYSNLLKYTHSNSTQELEAILYPRNPTVHYAVLNNRDLTYLGKAGYSSNRLHLLLNPVNLAKSSEKKSDNPFENKKLWLYPSRCIRRKNMGEFLLWSALADKADNIFASTLKPTSDADMPFYNRWKALASENDLPVEFEIGLRYENDFSEWIQSAHSIVTTSVGEGFGLAFLEPFLFKKPIVGRDIPDITVDFKEQGIKYHNLYSELKIPVDWIGKEVLFETIQTEMCKMYTSYNAQFKNSMSQSAYNAAVKNGLADFGRLNEALQEKVIKKVVSQPSLKDDITPNALLPEEYDNETSSNNYDVTIKGYGLDTYRDNLIKTYESILNSNSSDSTPNSQSTVLEQFLCPEDFYLLRS